MELKVTKPRDIAGGDFTYGERIALARILQAEDKPEYECVQEVIACLHDIEITPAEAAALTPYVTAVALAFRDWLEQERKMFHIPSTQEELQAGVERLAQECGDMGGVVAMAEEMHWTFDQVYAMPYLEWFTRQRIHTAKARYERRLTEVHRRRK